MKYTTFENKVVDTDNIDHQHLSNIYWFGKLLVGGRNNKYVMARIETEFNGEILPYRPKSNFKEEIDALNRKGYLVWKEVDGIKIADIIHDGQIIGQTCYVSEHRDLIINDILKS